MLAKKFAVGFGIAILLPMIVYYGVTTFAPAPKWGDYAIEDYYHRYDEASEEEKIQLRQQKRELDDQREQAEKIFAKKLFVIAVPVGIIAIIIGALVSVSAIGTGLMFGGIFTLTEGYISYWSQLPDSLRFASLLVAFVVLIFIGYRKLSK